MRSHRGVDRFAPGRQPAGRAPGARSPRPRPGLRQLLLGPRRRWRRRLGRRRRLPAVAGRPAVRGRPGGRASRPRARHRAARPGAAAITPTPAPPRRARAACRAGCRRRAARRCTCASGSPGRATSPPATAPTAALGLVVAVVAEAMADGTWSRVKACPGPHCGWLFYDASRNRSQPVVLRCRCAATASRDGEFRARRRGATTEPATEYLADVGRVRGVGREHHASGARGRPPSHAPSRPRRPTLSHPVPRAMAPRALLTPLRPRLQPKLRHLRRERLRLARRRRAPRSTSPATTCAAPSCASSGCRARRRWRPTAAPTARRGARRRLLRAPGPHAAGRAAHRRRRRAHVPFAAPCGDLRACLHLDGGGVARSTAATACPPRRAATCCRPARCWCDGGTPLSAGDAEGFSAASHQFDSDITVGRHPRAAIGVTRRGELLAVACDGRAPTTRPA